MEIDIVLLVLTFMSNMCFQKLRAYPVSVISQL